MINSIKVYPHTYIDRADGDHFRAFHIAGLIHEGIMHFLTNKLGSISYEDTSTNEDYTLALNNVDVKTLDEIKLMYPNVSMRTLWNTKNSYY